MVTEFRRRPEQLKSGDYFFPISFPMTLSMSDGRVSLSELLCVRHKLMAKEPRYATQTQGRSAGRTG
ncbi:hypothetical protein, partial [Burkholderia dolosa]|uniref:hypothetical protein n=1 Tax=Burkholderia dolosa TaxID=152500 RepID=UPI001ABB0886